MSGGGGLDYLAAALSQSHSACPSRTHPTTLMKITNRCGAEAVQQRKCALVATMAPAGPRPPAWWKCGVWCEARRGDTLGG